MAAASLAVFRHLEQQVIAVRAAALVHQANGDCEVARALLRSCIVLCVAALDAYMHEEALRILKNQATRGGNQATDVARYLGQVTVADVTGPSAEGYIRYRLSYKTLVAPSRIDELLSTAGFVPTHVWLRVAMSLGTRPDRLRMNAQLQFDRRNQIAHEGDWDFVQLALRPIETAHADDCLNCIRGLVIELDRHLT